MRPGVGLRTGALVSALLGSWGSGASGGPEPSEPTAAYVGSEAVGSRLAALADLARARGLPAEVLVYGRSQHERPLRALRLGTRGIPACLIHGGLGPRDAAGTVACLLLARRLIEDGTGEAAWILVPAPCPDALDAYLSGQPARAGAGRSFDDDRDGLVDEDGPDDLDGDGEILRQRTLDPEGLWIPASEAEGTAAGAGSSEESSSKSGGPPSIKEGPAATQKGGKPEPAPKDPDPSTDPPKEEAPSPKSRRLSEEGGEPGRPPEDGGPVSGADPPAASGNGEKPPPSDPAAAACPWPPDPRWLVKADRDVRRERAWKVGPEGRDDDADGEFNEDPALLDAAQGFCGAWVGRGPWPGAGPFPGYAPEARALMDLSLAERPLVGWAAFAGTGEEVLRPHMGGMSRQDDALYERLATPLKERFALSLAREAEGLPGSDLDWAALHLGVPALRIPVWRFAATGEKPRGKQPVEGDWLAWSDRVLGDKGFKPWTAVPGLGGETVEVGGWRPFSRYGPPVAFLEPAAAGVCEVARLLLEIMPKLELRSVVTPRGTDLYLVEVRVFNVGGGPTGLPSLGGKLPDAPLRLSLEAEAAFEVLAGERSAAIDPLAAGASSPPMRWLLRGRAERGTGLGRLRLVHVRSGTIQEEVQVP